MKKWSKLIAVVVLIFGLVNVGVGGTFIGIGASKQHYLKTAMDQEKITTELTDAQIAAGELVDTMGEAQKAGDLVRSHRHAIAPTYEELLGGGRYDPTNTKQLTYAQAMNIENYLYLATASWGLTYMALGVGVALVLAGAALIAIGFLVYRWSRRIYAEGPPVATATV
jgi:hypothetical protein